jgi:hypothetical protein
MDAVLDGNFVTIAQIFIVQKVKMFQHAQNALKTLVNNVFVDVLIYKKFSIFIGTKYFPPKIQEENGQQRESTKVNLFNFKTKETTWTYNLSAFILTQTFLKERLPSLKKDLKKL